MNPMYISIEPVKTGARMRELLRKNGLSVNDIRCAMGFENPQAVYKWLSGKSLPTLDNFLILSRMLHVGIEDILVIDGDIPFYGESELPVRLFLWVEQEGVFQRKVMWREGEHFRRGV